jgi:hypothetical protein
MSSRSVFPLDFLALAVLGGIALSVGGRETGRVDALGGSR